ncbi:hypothetical protein L248_0926 [Schleiferilactobacillus shenzhenensis LY-73]|uniref:Major facilitator superfamily (MFS) profile domain-containing protein n=2 Tax=Schleiferilactobacillus shenzhenensis TaxID=1231337 RepID=U4TM78_9LACO|nr:hypothetical protein L248_0926 [Schleiferilactobacillus shenzhenensis LY-73]
MCAIIATGVMSLCGTIVETAMNITFPTLMKQFSIGTSTVQWMTTLYMLVVAIIVPMSAYLKRRFTTKALFITANCLFLLGVIVDAAAPSFAVLLLGRGIQGLGTGIALPLMFNIIIDQVPMSKIGLMMGVGTLITAIGPAIGPTFGGFVVDVLGWRYIFIFLSPLLVASLILGIVAIRQKQPTQEASLDWLSVALLGIAFITMILGFSKFGSQSFLSLAVGGMLLIAVISFGLLLWRSQRVNPILNFDILRDGGFAAMTFAILAFQIATIGLSFILPNYIQLVNGSSANAAGLLVLPGALLGAAMSPFAGRIYDNWGAKPPLMTGIIFALVGNVTLMLFAHHLSNVMIAVLYTVYMISLGISFGNIMTEGLSYLTLKTKSDGNAIMTTVQQIAGAVGTSVVAAIVAMGQAVPGVSQAAGTANGARNGLLFVVILLVLAGVLLVWALFFRKPAHAEESVPAQVDNCHEKSVQKG